MSGGWSDKRWLCAGLRLGTFQSAGFELAGQTKSLAVSAGGVRGRDQWLVDGQGQLMHDGFQNDVVTIADVL